MKERISIFLFVIFSTQSFAIGENEKGKEEEEVSSVETPSSEMETIPSYQLQIHYQSEIYEYVKLAQTVLKEESLSDEQKIEKLNQIYFQIKDMLWKLMSLLNYPADESTDDLKLASFLIASSAWEAFTYQVENQIGNQVWEQDVEQRVDPVGDRVADQISNQVGVQVRIPASYQVYLVLSSNFNFASAFSHGRFYSTSTVAVHYTFMIYQINNILRLLSQDGQNLRIDIAALLREHYTSEQISQILRSFQIPPPVESPLINTQLDLLRMHLPSPATESTLTLLTGLVATVALSSASGSNH